MDGKLALLYSMGHRVGVRKSEKLLLLNPCDLGRHSRWGIGGATEPMGSERFSRFKLGRSKS